MQGLNHTFVSQIGYDVPLFAGFKDDWIIFHYTWDVIPTPLTNSIIFKMVKTTSQIFYIPSGNETWQKIHHFSWISQSKKGRLLLKPA